MKKILLSLSTISAVAILAVVGTTAYFTDTETSTGNTFTAGTIDIAVDGQNPWTGTNPWVVDDIKPSTTHYMKFTIKNVGENTADVWKKITNVQYTGGLHPESEEKEDPDNSINNIGSVIHYDMYVNGKPLIKESDGYFVTPGAHHVTGNGVAGYWIYLGRIDKDKEMVIEQSYHMDSGTTNWAQGDSMTFDVELFAQQIVGGAPAPTGELPGYGRKDVALDTLNIGDITSETGHNLTDWSDAWVKPGWGGNYGGGSSDTSLRLLMGKGDTCTDTDREATFTMNAGSEYATQLTMEHLDGSQSDSFDVYVDNVKIGHYDHDGLPSELWKVTTFNLSTPKTGVITIKLVATDVVESWCANWGQVAFSNAEIK